MIFRLPNTCMYICIYISIFLYEEYLYAFPAPPAVSVDELGLNKLMQLILTKPMAPVEVVEWMKSTA
jgi:hypothetical protein